LWVRRTILTLLSLVSSFLILAACDADGGGPRDPVGDGGPPVDTSDEDNDTISDSHEGRRDLRDTDGDGVPDFLDDDSDGDGILDRVEAGDDDIATPPFDSDSDGQPDFVDLDSDNNGIPDATEGDGDNDGDGILDFADLDDDDDFVQDKDELGDHTVMPWADADMDGIPDFRDPDSDNDSILDGHERTGAMEVDTDGDGTPDWRDTDTDNDGIPDLDEAGDVDLRTAPVDSDGDMIPDFRDPDSDNDGLSDADELAAGSSRTSADTDGDGVTDLIEVGAGTDPTNPTDNPLTRGDFVFVVPYMEPPTPDRDTLEFQTSLQLVDLYFLFDISGSMSTEIMSLRTAVGSIIANIACADSGVACAADADCGAGEVCSPGGTCIEDPRTTMCVSSPWTGGGIYEAELENLQSLQPDPATTAAALSRSVFGGTENQYRAVWGVADPAGAPGSESGCATPMVGFVGCPAFREEAVKVLVTFTDEDSDGTETAAQAGAALMAENITFIGVWSGTASDTTSRQDLVDLANASGSLSGAGMPLVFNGMDAAVVPAVTAAITEVVRGVPIRATIDATDEPDDDGDSLQFIDHLEVNVSGTGGCTMVSPTEDTDGDGHDDAFPSILPGTPVCWDVIPLMNTTVMPDISPLVYKARLTVRADGSPVDSRLVFFLIPPMIPDPGGPD
jgi:Cys-rich repeat protein